MQLPKDKERNLSCIPGAKPLEIIQEIIATKAYENDYKKVTNKLIYKKVSYQQCIDSLEEIINIDLIPHSIK